VIIARLYWSVNKYL